MPEDAKGQKVSNCNMSVTVTLTVLTVKQWEWGRQ